MKKTPNASLKSKLIGGSAAYSASKAKTKPTTFPLPKSKFFNIMNPKASINPTPRKRTPFNIFTSLFKWSLGMLAVFGNLSLQALGLFMHYTPFFISVIFILLSVAFTYVLVPTFKTMKKRARYALLGFLSMGFFSCVAYSLYDPNMLTQAKLREASKIQKKIKNEK